MIEHLTIFSKDGCPGCVNAKALLDKYNVKFEEVKIDKDDSAKQFILARGHRTVPQIYRGEDIFVQGGWVGLAKMTESEIKALLYGDQTNQTL